MAVQTTNYAVIRAAIAGLLTAAGCPNVKDHQPLLRDPLAFLTQFATGAKIEGWTVSRASSTERLETSAQRVRRHRFVVRGYRGLEEGLASEATFQTRIEAICDLLRGDTTMAGTAELHDGPQVDLVDHRLFGPALAHYCEISITIQELLLAR